MDIFQFVDRLSSEPCMMGDEVYIEEGKWFQWDRIQFLPLDVSFLKENYGDQLSLSMHFAGKLLVRAGVRAEGKSFYWCTETTIESRTPEECTCKIDLRRVNFGTLEISLHALKESIIFDTYSIAVAKEIIPEQVLYTFLSPTYELCCEEPLYYRFSGERAYYSFENQTVHLKKDSSVDLMTYFNAFSAIKWKKYTNIDHLAVYVDFMGEAKAEIIHVNEKGKKVLAAWTLNSACRATLELQLGEYPDTGILGLRIHAKGECVLYGGGYLTDAPEIQPVRLGIGITTFRREESVKASVSRLGDAIAAHPIYHNTIKITVVDNGQSLIPADVPAATLIPNRNLGGTGGFMRSLIHYENEGKCTHCLFMDDDASCEAGSIFRSISFIRHAKNPITSISGAMLYENIQFLQWENGAWFDGGCHSLNRDFDLRDEHNLLQNEYESKNRIYGAWWFFFFPIQPVEHYAFPYFVRGDDIDFSYMNNFKIVSLNGVACWQQDFKTKQSALTAYLFIRSHVMHHLTIPHLNNSFRKIWKILWGHFSAYNNSYLYGSAACVNLAIRHILLGPKFWEKNIDPDGFIKMVMKLSKCEISFPLTHQIVNSLIYVDKNIKFHFFTNFIRKITFYGHVIPNILISNSCKNMIYKTQVPNKNRFFMRKVIYVIDKIGLKYQVLRKDNSLYWKNIILFTYFIMKLYIKKNKLYNKINLRKIWQHLYYNEKNKLQ